MNQRLLDYLPEMEFLEPATVPAKSVQSGHQTQNQTQHQAQHQARFQPRSRTEHQVDQQAVLAAGLLEVTKDAELDHFLFELVGADGAIAPAAADALVRALKRVARPLFPVHGATLSSGLHSGRAGADLKAMAARIFGLELEGLSPEDKEFEVARQFIRLARDVIDNVRANTGANTGANSKANAKANAGAANAQAMTERALQQAAQRHAPGLLTMGAPGGYWQRQGSRIVVFDC
jgi:hypothetical protein